MAKLRILVCDGNTRSDRAIFERFNGCAPSGLFVQLLKRWHGEIESEVMYPADPDSARGLSLAAYDGILFTGSNSNIHRLEPSTLRQIEFARAAFAAGTPMFGVCWGLQLAAVAAGGDVVPNRSRGCACEVPFAAEIRLTDDGSSHPMHWSRPTAFDAFAFHSDEVVSVPTGTIVTARNRHFIQAAEVRWARSTFWGVQYHPELSGQDMAGFLRACERELISGGHYASAEDVEDAAVAMAQFENGAEISQSMENHFRTIRPKAFEFKPIELTNWVERMVKPYASKK